MQRVLVRKLGILRHQFEAYKFRVERYGGQVDSAVHVRLRQLCELCLRRILRVVLIIAVADLDVVLDLLRIDRRIVVDPRAVDIRARETVAVCILADGQDARHDVRHVLGQRRVQKVFGVSDLDAGRAVDVLEDVKVIVVAEHPRAGLRHDAVVAAQQTVQQVASRVFARNRRGDIAVNCEIGGMVCERKQLRHGGVCRDALRRILSRDQHAGKIIGDMPRDGRYGALGGVPLDGVDAIELVSRLRDLDRRPRKVVVRLDGLGVRAHIVEVLRRHPAGRAAGAHLHAVPSVVLLQLDDLRAVLVPADDLVPRRRPCAQAQPGIDVDLIDLARYGFRDAGRGRARIDGGFAYRRGSADDAVVCDQQMPAVVRDGLDQRQLIAPSGGLLYLALDGLQYAQPKRRKIRRVGGVNRNHRYLQRGSTVTDDTVPVPLHEMTFAPGRSLGNSSSTTRSLRSVSPSS